MALTTHTPGGVPLLIIGPDSDPGLNSRQLGQITADHNPATGDFQVSAQVSQRATSDEIATFCDWVDTEVSQLLETGDPDGNGWVLETDVPDRWHKAAFPLELPDT